MDKQAVAIYSHAIKEYSPLELWAHYATWMKPEGVVPVTYRKTQAFTFHELPAGVKIVETLVE